MVVYEPWKRSENAVKTQRKRSENAAKTQRKRSENTITTYDELCEPSGNHFTLVTTTATNRWFEVELFSLIMILRESVERKEVGFAGHTAKKNNIKGNEEEDERSEPLL